MKTRRLWILVGLLLPIALLIAMRQAASWRPVKIGTLIEGIMTETTTNYAIRATDREVFGFWVGARPTLIDLKTGQRRVWPGDVTVEGEAIWKLSARGQPQLLIEDATNTLAYPLTAEAWKALHLVSTRYVLVVLTDRHVQMYVPDRFYRWNRKTRVLESDVDWSESHLVGNGYERGEYAITRDGRTFVVADVNSIRLTEARVGGKDKILPILGFEKRKMCQLSPFGSYVCYQSPGKYEGATSRVMVDARNGRKLWGFESSNSEHIPVFSPDEKWIAIQRPARQVWEVRETATGQIVGTIPSVFNGDSGPDGPALYGGFSPDGRAFYSITPNGAVYRQRAR